MSATSLPLCTQARVVVEVAGGITVYPARAEGDRWRAVWCEGGRRRQCESVSEAGLAARLVKVTERLTHDAPGLEEPGAALIAHYLSPSRHPADRPWSRKHADTQTRLCRKYLTPVIGHLRCEDIKTSDFHAAVNTAPTAGEGNRLARCISALVTAGLDAGYLTNPRLRNVRWQPGDRPAPEPRTTIAGESPLFVDQADIPASDDVTTLAEALAYLDADYELMAYTAAYTGLRWGELAALTLDQIDTEGRDDHRRPQDHRDRRHPAPRSTQRPQEAAHHLPPPHPRRLPPRPAPRRPHRSRPRRAQRRRQPARPDLPLTTRHLVAVLQLRPPRPERRLPRRRLARREHEALDLAQPPPRLLHHRPAHLAHRPRRRLPPRRPRQHPHHPRHVHRHHRRHPPPRPHRHRLEQQRRPQRRPKPTMRDTNRCRALADRTRHESRERPPGRLQVGSP